MPIYVIDLSPAWGKFQSMFALVCYQSIAARHRCPLTARSGSCSTNPTLVASYWSVEIPCKRKVFPTPQLNGPPTMRHTTIASVSTDRP